MSDRIVTYLQHVNSKYKTGISTEHTYRTYLQTLLEELAPEAGINVTNEPSRIACGAPDYIVRMKDIPLGYIEAKDVGADLSSRQYKEQFSRYRDELENLIITNYLEFRLYRYNKHVTSIRIAQIENNRIKALPENNTKFEYFIAEFYAFSGQTIKSASILAKMMAGKARLLSSTIKEALIIDNKI